jgi:hypothetical protein
MRRAGSLYGAVALAGVVGFAVAAEAETVHKRARHPASEGRQIVIHSTESFLTLGTYAPVGSFSGYALNTIAPGVAQFTPFVDETFVGVRGQDRIPSNLTVPNCCTP